MSKYRVYVYEIGHMDVEAGNEWNASRIAEDAYDEDIHWVDGFGVQKVEEISDKEDGS